MSTAARVFSPLNAQPPAEVVAQIARGARVDAEPGPSGWRALRLVGPGLDIRLIDAACTEGEAFFAQTNAAKRFIVDATPRGPTREAFRLHRFVGRARHVIGIEGFRRDAPSHQALALDLARLVYGVVQVDAGVLDSEGRWILDQRGQSQEGAAPRVMAAGQARRARTIAALAAVRVRIPEGLSLVESEDEALTCAPGDAKLRALALWRTFRLTCGAPELPVELDARVAARVEETLTERERAIIANHDKAGAGAGVEALWTLLYVLGAVKQLGPYGVPCSAEAAMDALDALTSRGALDGGSLRPLAEILDALDAYTCLAWKRAEPSGLPPPMNGAVVQMRLRALRWVTLDQFAPWDRVALDA